LGRDVHESLLTDSAYFQGFRARYRERGGGQKRQVAKGGGKGFGSGEKPRKIVRRQPSIAAPRMGRPAEFRGTQIE
jgi:hypothetical protein